MAVAHQRAVVTASYPSSPLKHARSTDVLFVEDQPRDKLYFSEQSPDGHYMNGYMRPYNARYSSDVSQLRDAGYHRCRPPIGRYYSQDNASPGHSDSLMFGPMVTREPGDRDRADLDTSHDLSHDRLSTTGGSVGSGNDRRSLGQDSFEQEIYATPMPNKNRKKNSGYQDPEQMKDSGTYYLGQDYMDPCFNSQFRRRTWSPLTCNRVVGRNNQDDSVQTIRSYYSNEQLDTEAGSNLYEDVDTASNSSAPPKIAPISGQLDKKVRFNYDNYSLIKQYE